MSTTETATGFGVIFNRGELLDALQMATAVIAHRNFKPVLACVRIEAADGAVNVEATDLERRVRYNLPLVQIERAGVVCVDGAKLLAIVRSLSENTVTLRLEGEQLVVVGNFSTFRLYTHKPEEFPPIFAPDDATEIEVKSGDFLRAIIEGAASIGDGVTIFDRNAIHVDTDKKSLLIMTTHGRALSLSALPLSDKVDCKAIVPGAAVKLIRAILTDDDATIRVSGNHLSVECGPATVWTTLMEGELPAYRDVIPKESDAIAVWPVAGAIEAIKQAMLLAVESENGSRTLRCEFSDKGVSFTSSDPQAGKAEVLLPCKYEGKDIAIGINGKYLVDCLSAVSADEIEVHLIAPNRPVRIEDRRHTTHIVMPVNITQ